ncbi:MAG: VIT1/CCC1 transporter family protein [Candidatus Saccharimonadales bacterium]
MKKHYYHLRHHSPDHGPLLSFVDGLEGGFAIFAGIVAGLSFTLLDRQALIVTALIGITVNAVNAATIRYSTEHYYDELDGHEKRSSFHAYFVPSIIEFAIYLVVSCLSLLPLLFIDHIAIAVGVMIAICLVILFSAGILRGKILHTHSLRDGLEIMLGGLIMIAIGTLAGWMLAHLW